MSKEKVAVIGSGPSALVCISELINKVSEITLFSPTGISSSNQDSENDIFPLVRKDRFVKKEVYSKFSPSLRTRQMGTGFIESHSIGGLSEIWGGVCLPQHYSEREQGGIPEPEYTEILQEICDRLSLTKRDGKVWEFFKTNSRLRKSILGEPPITLKGDEIWSAKEEINEMCARGIEFIDSEVLRVEKKGEMQIVQFYQDGEICLREFDRIFVACGPVGDAKLILNSFPQILDVKIADSSTEYRILLKFNFSQKLRNKMRPDLVGAIIGENQRIESYLQIYPISEQMLASLPFKRIQVFSRPFFYLVSKFISIGMIFKNAESSRSFEITRADIGFVSRPRKSPSNYKFASSKISSLIFQFGYLNTLIKIKNKPGTGIHSGAFISSRDFNYGKLSEFGVDAGKLHFVGASSLPVLPTGPITVSAMANSIYITRKIIKDLMV